jgi:hypothetical protein
LPRISNLPENTRPKGLDKISSKRAVAQFEKDSYPVCLEKDQARLEKDSYQGTPLEKGSYRGTPLKKGSYQGMPSGMPTQRGLKSTLAAVP